MGLCGGADFGRAGGAILGTEAGTGSSLLDAGTAGGGAVGSEGVGMLVFEAGVGGAAIFGGPPLGESFEAVFSTATGADGASVAGGASVRERDGAFVGTDVGETGRSKLAVMLAIPFLAPVFTSSFGLSAAESSFEPPWFAKAIFSAIAADVVGATEKRR